MALYRYLYLFFWNHRDGKEAWLRISRSNAKRAALILPAGHDVLVPEPQFAELKEVRKTREMAVQRVVVQRVPAPRDLA